MQNLQGSKSVYAFRLKPGDDLKQNIIAFPLTNNVRAACVLTCVGSLTRATLRFAGRKTATTREGPFEIVSLTGTIAESGAVHLHICLTDENGVAWGGHLMEGCIICTTAEIVVAELPGLVFSRAQDEQTGYAELEIETL